MTEIDLVQLAKEIEALGKDKYYRIRLLYIVLRDSLKLLGFWKYRPRGDPAKGYKAKNSKGEDNDRAN